MSAHMDVISGRRQWLRRRYERKLKALHNREYTCSFCQAMQQRIADSRQYGRWDDPTLNG